MLTPRQPYFLALTTLLVALCFSAPAAAFSIGSGFSDPCHERITLNAYQNYLIDLDVSDAPLANSKTWQKLADAIIKRFELEAYNDRQRLFIVTLLIGVRSPDTDGHAILDLESSRVLHTSPEGQYQHALRAIEDDGPEGDRAAVIALRKHIKDKIALAVEAFQNRELVQKATVYLDFYGLFETEVLASGYHLGQAIHALQDSFSHSLRSKDFHRIRHVMNYAEAMGGTHDELRDGLAHSVSMDQCQGETAPLVLAAEEATISLFTTLIEMKQAAIKTGVFDLAPIDGFLDEWVSYDEKELGCTSANDYCGSYWVDIAREHQTSPIFGCSIASSGLFPTGATVGGTTRGMMPAANWCLLACIGLFVLRRRKSIVPLFLVGLLGCPADPPPLNTQLDCTDPSFTPCGGSVRGVWYVTDQCAGEMDVSDLIPGCEGIVLVPDGGMVGTMLFGHDGKIRYDITQRTRMRWLIPKSCLAAANACVSSVEINSCDGLLAVFAPGCDGDNGAFEDLSIDGMSCTEQDDICSCSTTQVTPSTSEEGDYEVDGTQLHFRGSREVDFDYCVNDRIMTLTGEDSQSLPFGTVKRHLRLLKRRDH